MLWSTIIADTQLIQFVCQNVLKNSLYVSENRLEKNEKKEKRIFQITEK